MLFFFFFYFWPSYPRISFLERNFCWLSLFILNSLFSSSPPLSPRFSLGTYPMVPDPRRRIPKRSGFPFFLILKSFHHVAGLRPSPGSSELCPPSSWNPLIYAIVWRFPLPLPPPNLSPTLIRAFSRFHGSSLNWRVLVSRADPPWTLYCPSLSAQRPTISPSSCLLLRCLLSYSIARPPQDLPACSFFKPV